MLEIPGGLYLVDSSIHLSGVANCSPSGLAGTLNKAKKECLCDADVQSIYLRRLARLAIVVVVYPVMRVIIACWCSARTYKFLLYKISNE